jgi:aldehyde:ferredoxin oxidoreductase
MKNENIGMNYNFKKPTNSQNPAFPKINRNNIAVPDKKVFNNHEFTLALIMNSKSKANRKAANYHKHGFHTRVIEVSPGMFAVYNRPHMDQEKTNNQGPEIVRKKVNVSNLPGGYTGKILFIDLSAGKIEEETVNEQIYRNYIGGYGLGVRILYNRLRAKIDPLGPENILGLVTGPFTGTPVPTGTRYAAVAKSPLTGGWGDANSGGYFGPYLKFAGYDAVFFSGISSNPIYLLVDEGRAEIKDASDLWGKDTYETEDELMARYGKDCRVACIGPAGEKLSLIASIMTDRGSAAGRSGLGAVMGSKKIKAIVARGTNPIPIADKEKLDKLRIEQIKSYQVPGPGGSPSFFETFHKYGTSAITYNSVYNGDTPVKNWGGVGVIDVPMADELKAEAIASYVARLSGCWHCPISCKAYMKEGTGEYKYAAGSRRPEYETLGVFGVNCGNRNIEAINMANDICNRAGLDVISTGSAIAFATECYENGIITAKDTGDIELRWGNHQAMVVMAEQIARQEGLGAILAEGVMRAAEKIGRGAEKFAVHAGGQELGMHDPKLMPPVVGNTISAAARYQMDATPGRHTQSFGPSSFRRHFINAAGLCVFGAGEETKITKNDRLVGMLNAVTGWDCTPEEAARTGERIGTLRHAFNLREGINPLKWFVHPRVLGRPPLTAGPLAGVISDIEAQNYWALGALDWDRITTKPSKDKLLALGLDDAVKDLWPEPHTTDMS